LRDGSDLQGVYVPRRDPDSERITGDRSSIALKQHILGDTVEYDLVAARHYGHYFLGGGAAAGWRGAVWRLDLGVSALDDGGRATFVVTNLDRSWVWAERNVYGYLEYFRNGLGAAGGDYTVLSPELLARIGRGELFTLGRDYLGAGLRLEWNPRLNAFSNFIWNLNDDSAFAQFRMTYDFRQDLLLMAGIDIPLGGRGTEFGGVTVSGVAGFVSAGDRAYVRASYFF